MIHDQAPRTLQNPLQLGTCVQPQGSAWSHQSRPGYARLRWPRPGLGSWVLAPWGRGQGHAWCRGQSLPNTPPGRSRSPQTAALPGFRVLTPSEVGQCSRPAPMSRQLKPLVMGPQLEGHKGTVLPNARLDTAWDARPPRLSPPFSLSRTSKQVWPSPGASVGHGPCCQRPGRGVQAPNLDPLR